MFPNVTVFGISLYEIFFTLALISALVVLRIYGDRDKIPAKVLNFYLLTAVIAIIGGIFSASIFQALFNFFKTGTFKLNQNTGITFLGGLAGGIGIYLAVFFGAGALLFKDGLHKKYFSSLLSIAPCAISLAHSIGRMGCFSAGCCGGIKTNSPFGIRFYGDTFKTYPTQLFEAIFLMGFFIVLSILFFKKNRQTFWIYLLSYGIFRFLLEFIRGDERGAFIVSWLSPSQALSLMMVIIGGIVLFRNLRNNNAK